MGRNRLAVIVKICNICECQYNLNEFDECPVCQQMRELSKDFLNTTDDIYEPNNITPQY